MGDGTCALTGSSPSSSFVSHKHMAIPNGSADFVYMYGPSPVILHYEVRGRVRSLPLDMEGGEIESNRAV